MAHPLELKIPPVMVAFVLAGLMWLGARLTPTFSFHLQAPAAWAGVIALVGFVIVGLGVFEFRRARTTINPFKPATVSTFVTSGIYRRTRNPMYLGLLLFLVAWGVFLRAWIPLLLVPPVFVAYMNRFQIQAEERALRSRFGEEFNSYCARVRRWL